VVHSRRKEENSADPPRVAVIVPAYRARDLLPDCLRSLEAQEDIALKIILSDNDSRDGSLEYVQKHHPGVILQENKSNGGFSFAVNRGLKHASDAAFVALVNPDACAEPRCMTRLIRALKHHPEAGLAAARMMLSDPKDRIDSLGVAVTTGFGQVSIGSNLHELPGFDVPRFVPAACGGGMMIRAEVFDRIGGFDEEYFLCWEDVEFSLRAFKGGYRCLFVPQAVVVHTGGGVMGHGSALNVYHYCRGALPTAVKLLPGRDLAILLPSILLNRLKVLLLFTGRKRLLPALKGELASLPMAWRMVKKRGALSGADPAFNLRGLLEEGNRIRRWMKSEGGGSGAPGTEGNL
jgi:GT2 family glycosyltransferase